MDLYHRSAPEASEEDEEEPHLYEQVEKHDIRLLTILEYDDESIVCRLETWPLWLAPDYDAVSYCWGENTERRALECNGWELEIRTSLFLALRRFAEDRPQPHRPLWIDAMCLDQDDDDEKTIQVPRMGEIYESAKRTIVWLGDDANKSDAGFTFMNEMIIKIQDDERDGKSYWKSALEASRLGFVHESIYTTIWEAFENLLHRP